MEKESLFLNSTSFSNLQSIIIDCDPLNNLKKIPNDQYACITSDCDLVPEIININYKEGKIEFKCPQHNQETTTIIGIREYFEKEIKNLYYNKECINNDARQKNNLDDIFNYCVKCKKYICSICSDKHKHKSDFIKANEIISKCHRHKEIYNEYCKRCSLHLCHDCKDEYNCRHKKELFENIKPEDKYINILKNKRDLIIKNMEIEKYLIKLLDTLLETYDKHPSNYFHRINLINLAKKCSNHESIKYEKDEELLAKINGLENKILKSLNIKLDVKIKKDDLVLNLEGKNIGNPEIILLSGIQFNNLKELVLKNNNITNFEPLKDLKAKNLQKIDLSYNGIYNIESLTNIINNNENIEDINLSHNKIKEIEPVKDIKGNNPIIIDFSSNEIKEIKEVENFNKFLKNKVVDIKLDNNNAIKKELDNIRNVIGYIIKYNIDKSKEKIRLFGRNFVKNNKDKCKIIINEEEKELCEFYEYGKVLENKTLVIKLIFNKNKVLTNLSSMFCGCKSLSSLPDISKLNTSQVTNMEGLFCGCKLSSLPDISGWDTSKVTNMEGMFSECNLLSSLSDISKWDLSNVTKTKNMFYNCSSLKSLHDISKWNTSKITNMEGMFSGCLSLESFPDITKWDTSNLINQNNMFKKCPIIINNFPIMFR